MKIDLREYLKLCNNAYTMPYLNAFRWSIKDEIDFDSSHSVFLVNWKITVAMEIVIFPVPPVGQSLYGRVVGGGGSIG